VESRRLTGVIRRALSITTIILSVSACTVNPVTGQTELELVSVPQQIRIGEQQYQPAQQMQGGQYKVDPALSAYVSTVGQRLAAQSPVSLPYEFVVLNNSVPNAWALPGGKIAINRGLLVELRNEAELAAVLGHEIVHAAARHGAKSIERGLLLQSAVMAAQISASGVPIGDTLVQGVQTGAALINQKYGRDAEREADYYGIRYLAQAGYDPHAAVTLQETFVRLSQSNSAQAQTWLDGLFASHPPSTERVQNNRQQVEVLRSEGFTNGEYGADRYQAAVRTLKQNGPAYEQQTLAKKAMFDGQYDVALKHIDAALELQSAEAQFHGLRGDIRLRQGRYEDAIVNYDRAVGLDAEFFAYYLGRGVAASRLKQMPSAQRDLNQSLKLLPTTIAYLELGKIAEAQGDTAAAARYYDAAGQSGDAIGEEARASLARVDLPNHPERYLSTRTGVRSDGRWAVIVSNDTGINIADVRVRVDLLTGTGEVRSFEHSIKRLAAGANQQIVFPTDLGAVQSARALVIAASVAR
jgi:beta-barrel assembly-enhancing protease